jgi:hypothetical protein
MVIKQPAGKGEVQRGIEGMGGIFFQPANRLILLIEQNDMFPGHDNS